MSSLGLKKCTRKDSVDASISEVSYQAKNGIGKSFQFLQQFSFGLGARHCLYQYEEVPWRKFQRFARVEVLIQETYQRSKSGTLVMVQNPKNMLQHKRGVFNDYQSHDFVVSFLGS